jgi:hypothetical protein
MTIRNYIEKWVYPVNKEFNGKFTYVVTFSIRDIWNHFIDLWMKWYNLLFYFPQVPDQTGLSGGLVYCARGKEVELTGKLCA